MIRLIASLFVLVSMAAAAQSLPALYDVTGVASDDVLNIRTDPNAASDIIATLDRDSPNIEVVNTSENRNWGQVNSGESSGWVSMRYLMRQPDQNPGELPAFTSCFGTEPFWEMYPADWFMIVKAMGQDELRLLPIASQRSSNRTDRFSFTAHGAVGVLQLLSCNDGMSARAFGISIDLLLTNDGQTTHLSGCCTIQP